MMPRSQRREWTGLSRRPGVRSRRLGFEQLERRLVFSASPGSSAAIFAQPNYITTASYDGTAQPDGSSSPVGFTATQVRTAYGLGSVQLLGGTVAGNGAGQTIAIVDAYDDPSITGDLASFDTTMNLLAPPSFQVLAQDGSSNLPGTDPKSKGSDWEVEESLDVEWAHAAAPDANIILFEAKSDSSSDLMTAINTARNMAGVGIVSMSWGEGEYTDETADDATFTTPSGHVGVTFIASTGDNGRPGEYPAVSPNVVGVGGTTLSINAADNTYLGESAWTGGGSAVSPVEPQPAWQHGIATQSATQRVSPDVAFDANPSTGVAIYDSYDYGSTTPWSEVGGTSLAAPLFAGVMSIADQGRVMAGQGSFDGATQLLPRLYTLASTDFNAILTGYDGYPAHSGYNAATGLGSPNATTFVPDLDTTAQPPQMVADVNASPSGSSPANLAQVGTLTFFTANDGTHGDELWATAGTSTGTYLVSDIDPGSGSSSPSELTNFAGTLFFAANDGTHGEQLWESNGTSTGTQVVKNIGSDGLDPTSADLTVVGNTLFFAANDGTHGVQLWESNGSSSGTQLVDAIRSGTSGANPEYLTNVSGTLYFVATDTSHGTELWKSNGTSNGTSLVSDIVTGTGNSYPTYLTNVNGTLYFTATDGTHTSMLWKSNGSSSGTILVKDIYTGTAGFELSYFVNFNGTLFFDANDGTHGYELWSSNGTSSGTTMVRDIAPSSYSSVPRYLTVVGSTLFFQATDPTHGTELWATNGTSTGTQLVSDIVPGLDGSYPTDLTNVGGTLFFQATDGTHGFELWQSGGTSSSTSLVSDINAGTASSYVASAYNANGTLLFVADDGKHGLQLWTSNGTSSGTSIIADLDSTPNGSYPTYLTNVSGTLFFTANDGVHGSELWATSGVSSSTVLVADLDAGATGSYPRYLTNVGGTLFFAANDGVHGSELWQSNGTSSGTSLVADIAPGAAGSSPHDLTTVNGTLYFVANDGSHGTQLWAAGGSSSGAVMVSDINPGGGGGSPHDLTNVDGTLFFAANDGTHGSQLWLTAGGSAGAVLVADINTTAGSYPTYLTNVSGRLFFTANDGLHGTELWTSNGTSTGTLLVGDIAAGSNGSAPRFLTNVNGVLYFQANDGTHGAELWRSNGTSSGTSLVDDINPGSGSANPSYLTNVAGALFFAANDGAHGTELWESNGTSTGTYLVSDIAQGSAGSYPKALTNVAGLLYFQANDGTHGTQLWQSGGTSISTRMLADIQLGNLASSSPQDFSVAGSNAYFSANDGSHGSELWVQPLVQSVSIVAPTSQTTIENSSSTFNLLGGNAISVADADVGNNPVQVTLSVQDGTLTLTPGTTNSLSFAGGASGQANMTFSGTLAQVNAALAALVYTPAGSYYGSDVLSVTSSDTGSGGPQVASASVLLADVFINQPPSFTAGTNQIVNENSSAVTVSGWATNISPGPADQANETVTFLVSNDNTSLFSQQPAIDAAGNLTYVVAPNVSGTADVSVKLMNSGGTANSGADTSAGQSFTITVNFVNQPPNFTAGPNQTVNENSAAQSISGWATNVSPGPSNQANETLAFLVSNDDTSLFSQQPAIDASGNLTYTLAPNVFGTADVNVALQNSGGTAYGGQNTSPVQTFTITVNFVNQAPSFVAGANQVVMSTAGAQMVSGWATSISPGPPSEASQTLNFIVAATNPALFSTQPAISPTGQLTFTPNASLGGTSTITVTLHDSGGTADGGVDTSPVQTFTIMTEAPITIGGSTQSQIADNVQAVPLAQLSLTDPNTSVTAYAATLTLSAPTAGALSNLSSGSYDATTGVYTISSSSLANVQAALAGLVFTPAVLQLPAGQQVTTTFALSVGDGLVSVTSNSTTVTTTAGPAPITLTGRSVGDSLVVTVDSSGDIQATLNGATTTYTTATTSGITFNGDSQGNESVEFVDASDPYTATLSLGSVQLVGSDFSFNVQSANTLYVYAGQNSTAKVNVPAGPNFFVGVAQPDYGYIYGGGVYSELSGFGSEAVVGSGGSTYAYLYSTSHATIQASSTGGSMTAGSLSITASSFPQLYAVGAADGTDSITLDSSGAKFVGTPQFSYASDATSTSKGTFIIGALYFEHVVAQASTTGTDSAYFYSYASDAFEGEATSSTLSGSDAQFTAFSVEALGFASTLVWASGGGSDTVSLLATGSSTFVGTSSYSTLSSGSDSVEAVGYALVTATGTATDTAYLYDTFGSNTLSASGSSAKLNSPNSALSVSNFGTVYAEQKSGSDTASVSAIDFALQEVGSWTPAG